ncbi:MAG: rubrerythrin [Verrucomicrobia bacterium]|nr:rubrerythrin [Verrucomicrobiota bacterium]
MNFRDLTEREIVALAISAEEEDGRIYADFAEALRSEFPATAALFDAMKEEESTHRHRLIDLYRLKFGEHIPLIRREDVRGFYTRRTRPLGLRIRPERARAEAARMEIQSRNFYQRAAQLARDASIRQLLGDLAAEEARHEALAEGINAQQAQEGQVAQEHDSARRSFVLQIVQPGLAGLMDGSVSTLAPLFAAAFATNNTAETFRVGLAASVGAGISMGFAEALSDDGKISGRGSPLLRGSVCGLMTTLGGIGHTLPYLIADFHTATGIAIVVVLVELAAISWIRWRYMETSPVAATTQVALGGALVFVAGWLIGST